jgi:hypothetical protein
MPSYGVYGPSGHGKSTAIHPPGGKGLDPADTFIICSDMKALPFRGSKVLFPEVHDEKGRIDLTKSRFYTSDQAPNDRGVMITRYATNAKVVLGLMQQLEKDKTIKNGVIDTLNHLMTHMMQARAYETGFEKFTDLGRQIYDILDFARKSRINWFILMHSENEYDAMGVMQTKVQTLGKLLDRQVNIPSLFTVMLFPVAIKDPLTEKVSFHFRTRTNGNDVTKAPHGMFEELIPNDYGLVLEAVEKYENTVE